MADGQAREMPDSVKEYIKDGESDIAYRLFVMSNEGSNMDNIDTGVDKEEAVTAVADGSPVSDAGTAKSWEIIGHDDAKKAATDA